MQREMNYGLDLLILLLIGHGMELSLLLQMLKMKAMKAGKLLMIFGSGMQLLDNGDLQKLVLLLLQNRVMYGI